MSHPLLRRSRRLLLVALVLAAIVATGALLHTPAPPRGSGGSTVLDVVGAGSAGSPRLRAVDGPPAATHFTGQPPLGRGRYFPVAVWYESVTEPGDVSRDRGAGINTYLEVTSNSDVSVATSAGMRVVSTLPADRGADGYLLPDEVDMWAGPGSAAWTGSFPGEGEICSPADKACGYTVVSEVLKAVPADMFVWGQFGKGVTMWESDEEARGFVNGAPDGVSADNYWFTDPNICGESEGGVLLGRAATLPDDLCRRGYNYGLTVERMRSLVVPAGSKPVWNFVEVGHPFTEDDAPTITGRQIADAVWSGLIHGARGIVYFNHSFGGDCESQHVLRDACGASVRPAVTSVNRAVRRHARLLNAPFADGVAKATGSLDVSVKLYRGRLVLLVGRTGNGAAKGTVKFGCSVGGRAVDTATGETVKITARRLRLGLGADKSVRILTLAKGRTCGLSRTGA